MSLHLDGSPIDISVIMPVYNVGEFLANALDTLLAQIDPPRFEIIICDDGSTDNTHDIIHQYASAYPHLFVVVLATSNGGTSVNRNIGFAKAKGTYVTFVDGDDLVPKTALRSLFNAASHYDVDVVKGNHLVFDEQTQRACRQNVSRTQFIFGEEILRRFYKHDSFRGHTWGKLLRRDVFSRVQHEPGVRMAQDALFFAEALGHAKSMVLIPEPVYEYRLRAGSTTQNKYESNAYLWWLYSVDKSAKFARTPQQRAAYATWQIRTFCQIAREAHKLDHSKCSEVIQELSKRINTAQFTSVFTVLKTTHSARWSVHFIQLRLMLKSLTRRCALSSGDNSLSKNL